MNGVWLTGFTLIISLVLLIIFYSKKKEINNEAIIYEYLIIGNLLFACTGFLSCVFMVVESNLIISIIERFNLVILLIIYFLLTTYTLVLTNMKKEVKGNVFKILLSFLVIVLLLVLFVPINIINYKDSLKLEGLAYLIFLIGVGIYFIINAILVSKYFSEDDDIKKKRPLLIILLLFGIALLFRIWHFEIIEVYISTFALLIMYFTLENPDNVLIEELEQAKNLANQENEAKTCFIASMHKKIQEPIDDITKASESLMEAKSLKEAKAEADNILNATDSLSEIVNDVFDVTRIEAGKLEITEANYNAKDTFLELAKRMSKKMQEKNLEFSYNIGVDLPEYLYGDVTNLKKIITNLLSNAYKYTDEGYVHFEVSSVKSNDVVKLIISVEDSGKGIKKENVDKLFTKSERLADLKNENLEGASLGLVITKELVEMMGGRIIVHTIYGEGSKFTVVLNQKLVKGETSKEVEIEATQEKETIENEAIESVDATRVTKSDNFSDCNFAGMKIIVVDDDTMNLKVSKKLLERCSITDTLFLNNGEELISKIKDNYLSDAIFLDIMMPRMNGREVLEKLKEIKTTLPPIVALTANATKEEKEKYLTDGFYDYLTKPIEKDELIRVLKNIAKLENTDIEQTSEEEPIKEDNENDAIKYLKSKNVNIDNSLELLGDIDMYNDTIKDFLSEVEEKFEQIEKYKEENNMKEYSVLVHSLKSDCKYLGFMNLADLSYQHELKSKEENTAFVNDNFQQLKDEYEKVLEIAKEYQEKYGK